MSHMWRVQLSSSRTFPVTHCCFVWFVVVCTSYAGTFVLTDEPVAEPPRMLVEAVARAGLAPDSFVTVPHGSTLLS